MAPPCGAVLAGVLVDRWDLTGFFNRLLHCPGFGGDFSLRFREIFGEGVVCLGFLEWNFALSFCDCNAQAGVEAAGSVSASRLFRMYDSFRFRLAT